jgi:hypothetical protein
MPWGRIDDGLYDHPKLDALGRDRLACIGLHMLAISWSNRFLTDGFVPAERVRRLGGTARLAGRLVYAGLWERVGDDFRIHDFLDFNDSAEVVRAEREAARERMRVLRNTRRTSGEVRDAPRAGAPTVPLPSVPTPPAPRARARGEQNGNPPVEDEDGYDQVRQWLAGHGAWVDSPKLETDLARLVDRDGVDRVLRTMGALWDDGNTEAAQLIYGARNTIHPLPRVDPRSAERQERADEEQRHHEAELARTRRMIEEEEAKRRRIDAEPARKTDA